MKTTLHIKFLFAYLVYGFLCIFCVASITHTLFLNRLESSTGSDLYQEANLMATEYLPSYFSFKTTLTDIDTQFRGMQNFIDANIWFVQEDGTKISSCTLPGYTACPNQIADFNPVEFVDGLYQIGTYHDYFSEDMITVIAPVTQGWSTKGYLLIHKPYRILEERCNELLFPVYVTVFVIYLLSFLILIVVHLAIYRPLRKIAEAAKQYASGNLEYEIPIHSQDEIGYLSASLNYMSSQLRDMDDYQKKFIGNVSHDFRSPLTSIKGYLEAMADGTIPQEMQERYFKILLFETERLTDLTKDLLTLNEFDTKNLLLDKTKFDIHDSIKQTANSFEGTCTPKRISLELLLASKTLYVYADQRKIQQVLYNLLDNAIKFSSEDSVITIETTEHHGKVFISVKDRGIGIPKKSIPKIWDRFYKSDLSRGKDKKGTGLGLSIVKEIIQSHDENITVISTEGVGTEFTFSLPKAEK